MYLNDAYVTSLLIDKPSSFGSHKDYLIAPFSGNH